MDTIKTVDDIMAERPCDDYTREVVAELVGDGITAVQCAALDIPLSDRLWGLVYVWLDDRQCRLFAADCAERALLCARAAGREPDERSWQAVRVARGEATDKELGDVLRFPEDGHWDAARVAAWYAAPSAAWVAALIVARAAALYPAGDPAKVATRAAGAAWSAERQWQLDLALEYIRGEVE
jgi:hypothetical protein